MGAVFRLSDRDLSGQATLFVPSTPIPGLKYLNFFNGAGVGERNLADGGGPATVVGAPTVNASHWAMKSRSNFIETALFEPFNYTAWIIYRTADTLAGASTQPELLGTFEGSSPEYPALTSAGIHIYQNTSTGARHAAGRRTSGGLATSSQDTLVVGAATNWKMAEFKGSNTLQRARDLTVGGVKETAFTDNRLRTGNKVRIGSGYTSLAGVLDVAFAAVSDAYETDAVGNALRTQIAPILTALGITI